jgi:FAD/FMN-containing dehydrogenase
VKISSQNSIPFLTTGGGHGFSDLSSFNGLSIDLSKFNTIHLDLDQNRVTVGGSTRVSQLIDVLYDAGKELRMILPFLALLLSLIKLALGSCKCVGVIGATIGGGIGSLHGVRGLLSDALESVRVVTATGEIIEASASQHSDLFWAVRGAGSNFGIIVSATYRIYDITNGGEAVNADFVFAASSNASFWELMKTFDDTLPSQLAITAVAIFNRTSNEVGKRSNIFQKKTSLTIYCSP